MKRILPVCLFGGLILLLSISVTYGLWLGRLADAEAAFSDTRDTESCTDHRVPSQPGPGPLSSYSGQLFAGGGLRLESLSQFLCDRIAR